MLKSMTQLKKGDKFVVLEQCKKYWNHAMDIYLGKTLTISSRGETRYVKVYEDEGKWSWESNHVDWNKTNGLYNESKCEY